MAVLGNCKELSLVRRQILNIGFEVSRSFRVNVVGQEVWVLDNQNKLYTFNTTNGVKCSKVRFASHEQIIMVNETSDQRYLVCSSRGLRLYSHEDENMWSNFIRDITKGNANMTYHDVLKRDDDIVALVEYESRLFTNTVSLTHLTDDYVNYEELMACEEDHDSYTFARIVVDGGKRHAFVICAYLKSKLYVVVPGEGVTKAKPVHKGSKIVHSDGTRVVLVSDQTPGINVFNVQNDEVECPAFRRISLPMPPYDRPFESEVRPLSGAVSPAGDLILIARYCIDATPNPDWATTHGDCWLSYYWFELRQTHFQESQSVEQAVKEISARLGNLN